MKDTKPITGAPADMSAPKASRFIDLEGCFNFRDLGGYATTDGRSVRWGQLYRSDALHHLTRHDVARLREQLGIRDVVDLRSTIEVRSEGRGALAHETVRYHHLPLFDAETRASDAVASTSLADSYFLLAQFAMQPIGRVINTLAETDDPAVFHCAAGKDRTGVIAAIVLGTLGVGDDDIVSDYVLTQENLEDIVHRLSSNAAYQATLSALPPDALHAEPQTMAAFLQQLRTKFGSLVGYARTAGVSEANLQSLQARLLVAA